MECSLLCLLSKEINSDNSPSLLRSSIWLSAAGFTPTSAGRGITWNSSPSNNASSRLPISADKTGTTLFVTLILISIFRRLRSRSLRSHCVSFVTCAFSVQSEKSKISILLSDAPVTSFSFRSSCRTSNPFAVWTRIGSGRIPLLLARFTSIAK